MSKDNKNNDNLNDGLMKFTEEDSISIYTNSVNLAFGYYDFQLLFREQYPSFDGEETEYSNYARIVMSPQHAKILNMILEKNIALYENEFGDINVSESFLESINLTEE